MILLINVLFVATWYLCGIAYMSLSWCYWPKLESNRGKWTPRDMLHTLRTHSHFAQYRQLSTGMQILGIFLGYSSLLSVWPIMLFFDAKRKFHTIDDRTPTS